MPIIRLWAGILRSPDMIARTFREVQVQAGRERADLAGQKERIVKLLVQEVVVSRDGLLIRLRLHSLKSLVAEIQVEGPAGGDGPADLGKDGQTVEVRMPMEFKFRGGRREIILSADAEAEPKAQPNRPLVLALARAYKWQRMLDAGEIGSIEELAAARGVDRSYVGRIICLAAQAPEMTEAILSGIEPEGSSLKSLRQSFPAAWAEQRTVFGFGGSAT
jgi:hypothetical protein